MDFIFEIIIEFILEGSLEICQNPKINFFLRLGAFLFLCLFYGGFFLLLTIFALSFVKTNLIGSIFILFVDLLLLFLCVWKVYKYYKKKQNKED